ncbi:MAG: DUF2490 domain-containing protein [Acidobacteria bacterium]|nr:DUF2490 domain-containing protein [Acidobacteriota bacterium]
MLRKVFLLILLCGSLPVYAEGQNWSKNSITLKQPNGFSFHLVSEVKYRSWDWKDGVFKKNWVFGVGKKLGNGFSISLNYKEELTRKSNGNDIVERRPFVDVGWKQALKQRMAFDFRLRTEANQYIQPTKKDHYSFRFRFRLTGKTEVLSIHLEPYIAIEPFYDTLSDSFRKYRFYTGAMVPLHPHVKLRVGYIRQDTRGTAPDHIFNTGLSFTF